MKAAPPQRNSILDTASLGAIYLTPPVVFLLALGAHYFAKAGGIWLALLAGAVSLAFAVHLRSRFRQAWRKQTELNEQLVASQKLASIGQMASGIAHEINNPLAIIGQEAEWMSHLLACQPLAEAQGVQDLRDSLAAVQSQIRRCGDITHGLLNLARKMDPVFQETDVNRTLEDMAKLVEREACKKNVEIKRDYQEGLPHVFLDPPLFRQVALNLLTNALHAVEPGGRIELSTRTSGGQAVEIDFKDNGCGIAPENLPRIFDPFFTTKAPGQGTGLGLSLSHQIVVRLGGRIEVSSKPGEGAQFKVILPLRSGRDNKQGAA